MELLVEPRPYQKQIFENVRGVNSLVILPTGTGKTIIAYMLIIDVFNRDPSAKVLFLAPTKPLCVQHMQNFKKLVKGYDEPAILTGELSPKKRADIWKKHPIIFATPQTIKNDVESGRISLNGVRLLIVDEAHRAVGNYAYVDVAAHFMRQAKGFILALTASPASEKSKIREICDNLHIENIESMTEEELKEFLPDKKVIRVEVDLPTEIKQIRSFLLKEIDKFKTILKEEGYIRSKNLPRSALLSIQKSLQERVKTEKNHILFRGIFLISVLLKLQHALTILELYGPKELSSYLEKLWKDESKSARHLRSKPEILEIKRLTDKIKDSIEHPKFPVLLNIIKKQLKENPDSKIMVFVQFRSTTNQIYNYLKDEEGIRPVRFVGQAGADGLKQDQQVEIVRKFKEGKYNVLIATSISEEGIDIVNADVAILFEAVPSAIRNIQRRGRVGRINFGKVYILVTKDTSDQTYYYVARRKERKMRKIIDDMKKEKQKRLDELWA